MPLPKERLAEILKALTAELPDLLQRATQITLRDSLPTQLLVRELESEGYRLDAELDCTFVAIPVEVEFDRSLTDADRTFLHLPSPEQPSPEQQSTNQADARGAQS